MAIATPEQSRPAAVAAVSIVIPAYGHCPHLADLVRSLLAGRRQADEIIVSHTGPGDPTVALAGLSERLRVLHQAHRMLGGGARNRGAAVARGQWLAFIDADVIADADWLLRLLERVETAPARFAVGAVGYATAGGYWGLCNWLCEFGEQAPWARARIQAGGASCSMIVRADDFRAAGMFPECYQPGEDTMLFARLTALGREQWFEPAARVDHHNQAGLRAFIRHQYRLGYHSALVRQQATLRGSVAARSPVLAVLVWAPRLAILARRMAGGGPRWWLRGAVLSPGLVLGAVVWGTGFAIRVLRPAGVEPQPAVQR